MESSEPTTSIIRDGNILTTRDGASGGGNSFNGTMCVRPYVCCVGDALCTRGTQVRCAYVPRRHPRGQGAASTRLASADTEALLCKFKAKPGTRRGEPTRDMAEEREIERESGDEDKYQERNRSR